MFEEPNWSRREVLQKGAIVSGGLVVGGATLGGTVSAKNGGTGFITEENANGMPVDTLEEGEQFTVGDLETFATDVAVECEAGNKVRSIYTKYSTFSPDVTCCLFLWVKGEDPLTKRDVFRVNKVRDCGTLTSPDFSGGFEVNKVTFSPAKP